MPCNPPACLLKPYRVQPGNTSSSCMFYNWVRDAQLNEAFKEHRGALRMRGDLKKIDENNFQLFSGSMELPMLFCGFHCWYQQLMYKNFQLFPVLFPGVLQVLPRLVRLLAALAHHFFWPRAKGRPPPWKTWSQRTDAPVIYLFLTGFDPKRNMINSSIFKCFGAFWIGNSKNSSCNIELFITGTGASALSMASFTSSITSLWGVLCRK